MVKQLELISVVVPVFNEAASLPNFNKSLLKTLATLPYIFEVIYCDDGSLDATNQVLKQCAKDNRQIKVVRLSRNYGKENALTAGIAQASGAAIITVDGDGQHPVELLPSFIEKWQGGARIVTGVRQGVNGQVSTDFNASIFYRLFNLFTNQKLVAGTTDFRLIDKEVRESFLSLQEGDRVTRGLIDWLGYEQEYVYFKVKPRINGQATYNYRKRVGLAANSFVSLTVAPLYLFGILGVIITILAFILGLSVIVEQFFLGDPLGWNFTGTAMLGILIIFLVGIVLMSQGMLSLYVSHVHSLTKRRPLYIVDQKHSVGIKEIK